MIKRLIFDLDETIITGANDYDEAVYRALKKLNYPITENLANMVNKVENEYEKQIEFMDRQNLLEFLNKNSNINFSREFIDIWMKELIECVPKKYNDEDYQTLDYLYNRYELVILTNWFEESQVGRLKKIGIYKFFKEVYSGEKYVKPYKEAFLQAVGNRDVNECAMIGDDINIDIIGAQNAGIKKVVWKDNKNQKDKYEEKLKNVDIITNLKELKEIF